MSKNYTQIVKSSSIIGGANGFKYLIRLASNKILAVLLGPSGVGLVSMYQSIIDFVRVLSGMGIQQSGVREVAAASASGDEKIIAANATSLIRLCFLTGLWGALLLAVAAPWISEWTFDGDHHAKSIACLGLAVFFSLLGAGQLSLLQGKRRIADVAKAHVLSALVSLLVAAPAYYWFGLSGVVPVLVFTALGTLIINWSYARRIDFAKVGQVWRETFGLGSNFLKLGVALMWGGLLAAAVAYITRSWIIRDLGLEANGLYQAAWSISGMFAGFILSAMGMDYYPHLTSKIGNHDEANELVNQQIEVGILLALPGVVATLVFAPWIIRILYSAEFSTSADLLPWILAGVFARVVSWPLGFLILAKGASGWFFVTQTHYNLIQLGLVWFLMPIMGLTGVALAFSLTFIPAGLLNLIVARKLTHFAWSSAVCKMVLCGGFVIALTIVGGIYTSGWFYHIAGSAILAATSYLCLKTLIDRLGEDHAVLRKLKKIIGS